MTGRDEVLIFLYFHEQTQVVGYQLCAIPRYLGANSNTLVINEKTFVPTLPMAVIEMLVQGWEPLH